MKDRKDRFVWESDHIKITPPDDELRDDDAPRDKNPPKQKPDGNRVGSNNTSES